ncbi:MAG TPA: type IV pilus biogenesis/stability protein PilW [Methylophilaceae bacterium]|nr:type IV pilus biogenesis/stability protein PilW [Methylophilaceae bacterium]
MKKFCCVVVMLLSGCANMDSQEPAYSGKESTKQESARIHTELGAGYLGQYQMAIALEEFTEAVRIDPNYALAYNGLGMVYAALKEDAKADDSFKKSVRLQPGNSETRNNYGTYLCSRNRIDESITQFMEAVKNPLYRTPSVAYVNAGFCALRKKDIESAEKYLQQALAIQPSLNQAAFQLATIYFDRQQYELARNTIQSALLNNPLPDILWLAIRIERLLGNKDAVSSYTLELRKRYPNSAQAKALIAGE